MNITPRTLIVWLFAAVVIFLFWSVSNRIQLEEHELSFTDFIAELERGNLARATITSTPSGSQILGELENGRRIKAFALPDVESLVEAMLDQGVQVYMRDIDVSPWSSSLIHWIPIVIVVIFVFFLSKRAQAAGQTNLVAGGTGALLEEAIGTAKRTQMELESVKQRLDALERRHGD